MTHFFQKFDNNKINISRTKNYSTSVGQCLGFILFVCMFALLVFKIKSMINKDIMYLNSFQYFDRFPINMSNLGIRIKVIEFDYKSQFENGINITIQQVQWLKDDSRFNITEVRMVPCREDSKAFCVPDNIDMMIQGRTKDNDHTVRWYTIIFRPCNSSITKQCKQIQDTFSVFFHFNFRNLNISQKSTENLIIDDNTTNNWLQFAQFGDNYSNRDFYFMGVKVDTYQSFVPQFLQFYDHQHQQFWYYNEDQTYYELPRRTQMDPLFTWNFYRSTHSYAYERRFKTIDSIFGEIIGIGSIIGFVISCFIAPYTKWRYQNHIGYRIINQDEPNIGIKRYILSVFRKQKHSKQVIQALKMSQKYQDPLQNYQKTMRLQRIIEQFEQRLKLLQNQKHTEISNKLSQNKLDIVVRDSINRFNNEDIQSSQLSERSLKQSLLNLKQ